MHWLEALRPRVMGGDVAVHVDTHVHDHDGHSGYDTGGSCGGGREEGGEGGVTKEREMGTCRESDDKVD